MSTPPAHIAESIRNLTSAVGGLCELYATNVPEHLTSLLDAFEAELARWRQKVQDMTTPDR